MAGALPTVVLLHGGVGHGPWQWRYVLPELWRLGLPAITHDRRIPTTEGWVVADDRERITLSIHALLDSVPGNKILVGHSGGGIVATYAGHGRADVVHLVYVGAFMGGDGIPPRMSEAAREAFVGKSLEQWRVAAPRLWYHDCSPEDSDWAVEQLVGSISGVIQTDSRTAWKETPSTMIITTLDRAIPVERQREESVQAGEVLEIETGHSPFLAKPAELSGMIARIAERYPHRG